MATVGNKMVAVQIEPNDTYEVALGRFETALGQKPNVAETENFHILWSRFELVDRMMLGPFCMDPWEPLRNDRASAFEKQQEAALCALLFEFHESLEFSMSASTCTIAGNDYVLSAEDEDSLNQACKAMVERSSAHRNSLIEAMAAVKEATKVADLKPIQADIPAFKRELEEQKEALRATYKWLSDKEKRPVQQTQQTQPTQENEMATNENKQPVDVTPEPVNPSEAQGFFARNKTMLIGIVAGVLGVAAGAGGGYYAGKKTSKREHRESRPQQITSMPE